MAPTTRLPYRDLVTVAIVAKETIKSLNINDLTEKWPIDSVQIG
jgi:hypothetical protein